MNVPVEADGTLGIVDGLSAPGKSLTLRAERRHPGAGVELPADQQSLQRIRPHPGADGDLGSMSAIEVLRPGMLTTVQDWPGRIGYWHIGVPPSGPMDDLSFRIGNRVLGNPEGIAGPRVHARWPRPCGSPTAGGCASRARQWARRSTASPVPQWQSITVPRRWACSTSAMLTGPGMRCYVLLAGGLQEPEYLGSTATFTLGAFGGHGGRPLREGDVLTVGSRSGAAQRPAGRRAAIDEQPSIGHRWEIAVTEGPHGAPEFFTRADIDTIVGTDYTVHFNSDRTGVRLVGPKPQWARTDGGEAGLHPSNIHDNAYCVGHFGLHRRHPDPARS